MVLYTFRRLLAVVPVVFLITLLLFVLIQLAPGDPITLLMPEDAPPEAIEELRIKWGLDQPIWVQYLRYLSNVLTGDLGVSFMYGDPVADVIFSRLPATMELSIVALILASIIAIPLGLWAGANPNSVIDYSGGLVGFLGISMPSFWLGIMLILFLSGTLNLLPSSGRDSFGMAEPSITGFFVLDGILRLNWGQVVDALKYLAMPAIALGVNMAGMLMRVTRSSIIDVMHEDYITTARAKGAPEHRVLWFHGLKNAFIPILTIVGLELGALLSGSVIIETIFAWPGIGSLLISAINARDYPLVVGTILVYTMIFVAINFVIDLLYPLLDPRIRLG